MVPTFPSLVKSFISIADETLNEQSQKILAVYRFSWQSDLLSVFQAGGEGAGLDIDDGTADGGAGGEPGDSDCLLPVEPIFAAKSGFQDPRMQNEGTMSKELLALSALMDKMRFKKIATNRGE